MRYSPPRGIAFEDGLDACRWAQKNASGPFTAFVHGWECRVHVRQFPDDDYLDGWKWSYRDDI